MDGSKETTADRLVLTFDLFEFGVEMKAAQLRRLYPAASPQRIEELVDAWLADSPEIQVGAPRR